MAYDIGVVGLGVMGANLALNIEEHGFAVAGYDLDAAKAASFVKLGAGHRRECERALGGGADGDAGAPPARPADGSRGRARGRRDRSIAPHLEAGRHPHRRRQLATSPTPSGAAASWTRCGFHFVGMGVSGGEEGARRGPAHHARGPARRVGRAARRSCARSPRRPTTASRASPTWGRAAPATTSRWSTTASSTATCSSSPRSTTCCTAAGGLSAAELADVFAEWNRGELRSYLIEITADILRRIDPETGEPLVDVILDEAAQKGTGKWTSQNAFDLGAPIPTINAAVEARILSSLKAERVAAAAVLHGPSASLHRRSRQALIAATRDALYAREDHLLRAGLRPAAPRVDRASITRCSRSTSRRSGGRAASSAPTCSATSWRRSGATPQLVEPAARRRVPRRRDRGARAPWRSRRAGPPSISGIPCPRLSASLAYFDAYRTARLPGEPDQAQRDYFGAHTYQRVDRDGRVPHGVAGSG